LEMQKKGEIGGEGGGREPSIYVVCIYEKSGLSGGGRGLGGDDKIRGTLETSGRKEERLYTSKKRKT